MAEAGLSLTLGRVTIEDFRVQKLDLDSDSISLAGKFFGAPQTVWALRDGLAGYGPQNVDERVVPFLLGEDPRLRGFVIPARVQVPSGFASLAEDEGKVEQYLTLELQMVPGWEAPTMEVTRSGPNYRPNSNSVTAAEHILALPGGARTPRFTLAQDGSASVPVENGSIRVYSEDSTAALSATYAIVPESFYEGACEIEVSYDEGVSWSTVVGRQVRNLPSWVRFGNGRVRCTVSQAEGAAVLTTEVWDADAGDWEDTAFHVVDTGSATVLRTYTHHNISNPVGIAAGPDNRVYWASSGNDRIGRSTMAGSIGSFSVGASAPAVSPFDICEGPDGNLWFTLADAIGKMTTAGSVTTYTPSAVEIPWGICVGPDGNLWFTNNGGDTIGKITTGGSATDYADANISGPRGICEGPDGLLWFCCTTNDRIGKITTAGTVTTYSTGVGNAPNQICAGPDGLLWYTRTDDDAICKITTSGTVTTYTSGVPDAPNHIVSDGTDLWFTYQDGIGKITTSGTVTTYTNANVINPWGICVGPDGNLWFTSRDNNRIGTLIPGSDAIGQMEFGGTLTVLHNRPEIVSVRLGQAEGPALLDLTLRRGHNLIDGTLSTTTSSAYGIYRTAAETGATITGGIKANAANADGNIFTLLSTQSVTQDTTGTSGIYLASNNTVFRFGFGPTHDDTVAGDATIIEAFYSSARSRQRIVAT